MKRSINTAIRIVLLCTLVAFTLTDTFAQGTRKEREKAKIAEVKKLLESKNFKFMAQNASAMRGGTFIPLTSEYDLVISQDKITSYLPYFGRAFSAPINPAEGGIKFTSTKFEIRTTKRKRGRQDWIITFKDVREVRQMILNISETGDAMLLVSSNNRDPITFDGYITATKKE